MVRADDRHRALDDVVADDQYSENEAKEMVDSLIVQRLPGRSSLEARRFIEDTTTLDTSSGDQLGARFETVDLDEPVTRAEARDIAERLVAKGLVVSADPDSRRYSTTAPNDPLYNDQWYLKPFTTSRGVDIEAAWTHSTGSASTTIAVIDTGVLIGHPDLAGRVINGYDFLDNDADATDPGDADPGQTCGGLVTNSWHGTHVSGTIAANTNNAMGVAGIDRLGSILAIRILGRCGGSVADEAKAIKWAAGIALPGYPVNTRPAKIINLSLGSADVCTTAEQEAINAAVAAGSVVVVAAGNDHIDIDATPYAPANCPNVITVAATDQNGSLSTFSNFGSSVDVAAPGEHIRSTIGIDNPPGTFSAFGYGDKSGTSMAAPIVSGTIALILAANPALTPREIELLLEDTSSDFPSSSTCTNSFGTSTYYCGAGIVSASLAVHSAAGFNPTSTISTVTPNRIIDTRTGVGGVGVGRVGDGGAGGASLAFPIAGVGGVASSGVAAVSLNVTVTNTEATRGIGYVSAYPCLNGKPNVSNLNFTTGQTVPNAVIVPLDSNGYVCFFVYGRADVIVDVNGWFGVNAGFYPVNPVRVADTRTGSGTAQGRIGNGDEGGDPMVFNLNGVGGVPAGAGAVSLNVTAVNTEIARGTGYVSVYPCLSGRPNVSNLNFTTGQTVPNAVIVPVDANGNICLYVYGRSDLIIDVNGWFAPGSGFTTLTPSRVVDTRSGIGGVPVARIGNGSSGGAPLEFHIAGVGGVAGTGVTAVSLNVTVAGTLVDGVGYVTAYPCWSARPEVSNLNFTTGQVVPNAVIVPVDDNGHVCFYVYGTADLIVDVNGYFYG